MGVDPLRVGLIPTKPRKKIKERYVLIIAGIDPGSSGGISLIDSDGFLIDSIRMPVKKIPTGSKTRKGNPRFKTEIEVDLVLAFLKAAKYVFSEKPGPRPDDGPMQAFNYGFNFGYMLAHIVADKGKNRVETFHPAKWGNYFKKYYQMGKGKSESVSLAVELSGHDFIPKGCRISQDGMAESYLIARFGLNILQQKEHLYAR